MSRIGKYPIPVPASITVALSGQEVEAKGPKGVERFTATDDVSISLADNVITITPRGKSKRARQQWGMSRTMVANLINDVEKGFKKELEISGVGYRAQVQGNVLKLSLGLSHDVEFKIPEGITISAPKPTQIIIEGSNRQHVGQVAANIREWRKPEPYKGKGIRYIDEYIFRKEGKKK